MKTWIAALLALAPLASAGAALVQAAGRAGYPARVEP